MPKEIKVEAEEKNRRVSMCFDLLMKGWSQAEIVRHLHDKEDWNLTKRQLRNYVYDAQKMIATEVQQIDRRALLYTAHHRYEMIYREAMETGNHRDAMAALDRIVALWHLNVADALKVDWRNELEAVSDDPDALRDKIIHLLESGAS